MRYVVDLTSSYLVEAPDEETAAELASLIALERLEDEGVIAVELTRVAEGEEPEGYNEVE